MVKLPEKFTNQMIELLGAEDAEKYFACLEEPMYHALRINTLKISVEDFLGISPFELTPVPWCENAFYYDAKTCQPSKHPYYFAGLYYLQEPSATLPAATLPIEPGDKVLDICAAPGGKSTELLARLKGDGCLISNDISASRAKALLKNLELFGGTNYILTCEAPNDLAEHFAHYFDKILIDAPCSGEGMFRKSNSMITAWEQNGNELFSGLQHTILTYAEKMLKPGGMILYSTCTFAPLEDEQAVDYLMSLRPSLSLVPIDKKEGMADGMPDFSDSKNPELTGTARMFPHRVKGEGHYVALLQDDPETSEAGFSHKTECRIKKAKLPQEITDFLGMLSINVPVSRLELKKDKLYYIHNGLPDVNGIRTLRQGLLMGELKKNRFEPSQALAMALKKTDYTNCFDLDIDDLRVIKYLKGETIEGEVSDGWVLILVSGYPLGFGKAKNGLIKNKYLPGWRMM